MSEKLKPCWHCGKDVHIKDIVDEKGLLMHEFVCAEGSSCLGSGLFTAFFPGKKETAIDAWNTRAPIYTPVKPEDITDGHYWLVGPDGDKMVDRVVWKYTVGGAEDVHVNDLAEAGFTFYRIPDMEVAE